VHLVGFVIRMGRENFVIPTLSRVSINHPLVGHIIYAPESATGVVISLNMYAMLSSFGRDRNGTRELNHSYNPSITATSQFCSLLLQLLSTMQRHNGKRLTLQIILL
jgi:hypothetical protein